MADRLRQAGIVDKSVLDAMAAVPRHLFVDGALVTQAYEDTSLPIGHGQTISKPSVVARMIELLQGGVNARARRGLGKTLEIGTGCGYQAAVLAQLSNQVISIERLRSLHDKARELLAPLRLITFASCTATACSVMRRTRPTTASSQQRAAPKSRRPGSNSSRSAVGWSLRAGRCRLPAGARRRRSHRVGLRPVDLRSGPVRPSKIRPRPLKANELVNGFGMQGMSRARFVIGCWPAWWRSAARHGPPRSGRGSDGCTEAGRRRGGDAGDGHSGQAEATPVPLPGAENAGKAGYYMVKPGDTLNRIAAENGQNPRDLIKWNGLENPNVIEVGQVLRVVPPGTDPALAQTRPLTPARVETRPLTASSAPVTAGTTPTPIVPTVLNPTATNPTAAPTPHIAARGGRCARGCTADRERVAAASTARRR
jgi:LysM repeat protein